MAPLPHPGSAPPRGGSRVPRSIALYYQRTTPSGEDNDSLMWFRCSAQPSLSKVRSRIGRRTSRRRLAPFNPVLRGYRRLVTQISLGRGRIHPVPLPPRIPASSSALASRPDRQSHFAAEKPTRPTDVSRLNPNHQASPGPTSRMRFNRTRSTQRVFPGRWLTFAGWNWNPLFHRRNFLSSSNGFPFPSKPGANLTTQNPLNLLAGR